MCRAVADDMFTIQVRGRDWKALPLKNVAIVAVELQAMGELMAKAAMKLQFDLHGYEGWESMSRWGLQSGGEPLLGVVPYGR